MKRCAVQQCKGLFHNELRICGLIQVSQFPELRRILADQVVGWFAFERISSTLGKQYTAGMGGSFYDYIDGSSCAGHYLQDLINETAILNDAAPD